MSDLPPTSSHIRCEQGLSGNSTTSRVPRLLAIRSRVIVRCVTVQTVTAHSRAILYLSLEEPEREGASPL